MVGDSASDVAMGRAAGAGLVIGVLSLFVILGCKRWMPKVPGVLVAVVAVQSKIGGNMAEILDSVADTIAASASRRGFAGRTTRLALAGA